MNTLLEKKGNIKSSNILLVRGIKSYKKQNIIFAIRKHTNNKYKNIKYILFNSFSSA